MTGIEDEKYIYKNGLKMRADSDEKYIVVVATGDTGDAGAYVEDLDSAELRKLAVDCGQNKDGDTVKAVLSKNPDEKWASYFYLVNTSGAIVKNKTAAKDGDDWYFYVDDKDIVMYTNNKTLKDDTNKGYDMVVDLDGWKSWKDSTIVLLPGDPEGTALEAME